MLTEMKGIVVDFGPVRALDRVDLTIQPGGILGLLGENGAGKSTLMNVLAGSLTPNGGEICLDGRPVRISSVKQALSLGIRFIHQELSLCDDLAVFENMFLAEEMTKAALLNKKVMAARAQAVFQRMGVDIDPWIKVGQLQSAEKQLVEIARALLFRSNLIIMDEPTTALSTQEITQLFVIMRQLQAEGVSFVYISHKMPELFQVCQRYAVLRDGKLVAAGDFADVDESAITEMMIGHTLALNDFSHKAPLVSTEVALEVKGLTGEGFAGFDLTLHRGEIVAITGLQSSGRDELADALFGALPAVGEIRIAGQALPKNRSIIDFMRRGVAMVPRARKERGILNDLSILDNLSIGFLNTKQKGQWIRSRLEVARFARQRQALAIKTDHPRNPITTLSGGNQQKVILGRWLETDADILLFDNPTQGIDVGAKFEIYRLILDLARQGKAILVFSSEFQEIYKLADRCLVLYKGRTAAQLHRSQLTEQQMMFYATGSSGEEMHP